MCGWQVGGISLKWEAAKARGLKMILPRANYEELLATGEISEAEKKNMLIPVDDILDVLHHGLEEGE